MLLHSVAWHSTRHHDLQGAGGWRDGGWWGRGGRGARDGKGDDSTRARTDQALLPVTTGSQLHKGQCAPLYSNLGNWTTVCSHVLTWITRTLDDYQLFSGVAGYVAHVYANVGLYHFNIHQNLFLHSHVRKPCPYPVYSTCVHSISGHSLTEAKVSSQFLWMVQVDNIRSQQF